MEILVIVPVLALAAVIGLIWSKSRKKGSISFWDVVRNPDALPDPNVLQKRVEDAASSISGSAEEVAKLVDFFVFDAESSDAAWAEMRIIAKLGREAYPRALAILRDPSTHSRLVALTQRENYLPKAPICRLCEIFDQDVPPPPEASELLAPFLRSDSGEIRKSVALIIGSVGSVQSLPDLERALEDEDEYVKCYALMGVQRAIAGGRITQSAKGLFFDMVVAMWPEDTSFNVCDRIPLILLRLDRSRAVERLLQLDLFTAEFEPVWRILEAFGKESVMVDRSRLLALIGDASAEPIKFPMDNVLEGALSLLGHHRNQEDLPTLERLVDHPNENVSRGAIRALYTFHRYFEEVRAPWEVLEKHGWDSLTQAEKYVCAVDLLDGEVRNGGFAQYFFNPTGDHWQDALGALAAMGAGTRHQIMLAAIRKFGGSAPSSDRRSRNVQLSKVVRKTEDPFSEEDSAWYGADDENLDRLIFRYNLAHTEGRQKAEPVGGS